MNAAPAPIIGVLRPGSASPVVAAAEARVVRCELERRLGPVTLDLRIDGDVVGSWRPIGHAAWPAGVDAQFGPDELWAGDVPPLTALFARTVEPAAATVRAAMLRHLGVVPPEPFVLDDACLERLDPARVRPTDLWLIATAASEVTVGDVAVRALAGDVDTAALDAAFDRVVASLAEAPAVEAIRHRQLAHLAAERDELRARLAALAAGVDRDEADANRRLDELERENARWRDRCERAELQRDSVGDRPDRDDATSVEP